MQRPSRLARRATTLAAGLLLAACSDDGVRPPDPAAPEPELPATAIEMLRCTASISPARLSCASPRASGGGLSALIVGRQGVYVFLASSNVSYDPAGDSLTADVTVRNLLSQPMGTLDAVNPEPGGVRVFFHTGPTTPVTVVPDGTATFTASNQPYYQYGPAQFGGCCLAPQATTTPRRWKFLMNGASSFTFLVLTSTALPNENGVLRWQSNYDPNAPVNYGLPVLDLFTEISLTRGGMYVAGGTGVLGGGLAQYSYQALPNGPTDRVLRLAGVRDFTLRPIWGVAANGIFYRIDPSNSLITPVFVGLGGMRDIQGPDTMNVWAVGDSGRVLRWNGQAWAKVAQPATANLRAVHAVTLGDVWAGGEGGSFFHWTGSGWTTVAAPDTGTVNDIWAGAADSVWAVNVQQTGSGPVSSIFFYDGSAWSIQRSGIAGPLRSIHGAWAADYGPNNVYAAGGTRLLRFNGSVWYDEYLPLAPGDSLYSVHAINPSEAVAGGIGTVYIGMR